MTFLFLSPHFPPQYEQFCRALVDRGVTVLGLGDTPVHNLSPALRGWLTEYVHLPNLGETYDDVYRAVGGLISRHGRIHGVESLNEHWLELESQLREDFNVPGPKREEIRRRRHKTAMKEIFRTAEIAVPAGERLTCRGDLLRFVEAHGLPIVVKPDVGVGAWGAAKISTHAELTQALERPLSHAVVEEFIEGRIVSYDGLTDKSGNVVFCLSHVYSAGIMEIVTQRLDLYYYSRRKLSPALDELGRRSVQAFDLRSNFFHFEFFELKDGSYRALEGNFRPPGGFTTDMMNYTFDFDVYSLWAQVMLGEDLSRLAFERKYHCAHVGRRQHRHYRFSHDDLVKTLGRSLLWHRDVPPVFADAMGNSMYLIRHESEAALLEMIDSIEAT